MKYSENIQEIALLKPDYLGFIFWDKSIRKMDFETLPKIPLNVKKVGVFVDESIHDIFAKVNQFKLDVVQLHGSESFFFCKKVKIFLKTKQYEVNRKKVQNQKAKQFALSRIIKNLNELEGVEAINAFIEHAYTEGMETRKLLNEALKRSREGTIDSKELLDILSAANQFANGYSILDEISKEDIDRYFSKPIASNKPESELTPQDKLTRAIANRNNNKENACKIRKYNRISQDKTFFRSHKTFDFLLLNMT